MELWLPYLKCLYILAYMLRGYLHYIGLESMSYYFTLSTQLYIQDT